MKTTVIIPTYQGAQKIVNCLESLMKQTYVNFELIIAIDGSSDETENVVTQILKDFNEYQIVKQKNKGRAAIRNLGAKAATGDLLIFFDDDMRPFPNSIEKHVSFHQNNYATILQGAMCTDELTISNDTQKYKFSLEKKWEQSLINSGINKNAPYLSAAHFSIPTTIFNQLHGFDEKLKDAEDYELAIRMVENGHSIFYDKNIISFHDDPITLASYITRKREYAKAQEKLKTLYPKRILKYSQRSFTPRKGWKATIYKIVSSKKLVEMIDSQNWAIMMLPKSIRYRLYDIIIQGLSNYYPNKNIQI